MRLVKLNALKNRNKVETGIIIENKKILNSKNRFLIKLDELKNVPESGDYYLISFRGTRGVNKNYRRFLVNRVPDENNLLSLSIETGADLDHNLDLIKPGSRVKIKGPFNTCVKKAS
ncbi:hypothetical protein COSHB9_10860 [Companilactobacillus alimentarius]|uniref:FAD-binding FR-type domain-containing protein n=1 Tax=Companilactobacillus alimentarius DSM 20249 TaxID=1423720 RepID=A0A2K9HHM3_9LACO|nr:hypothetical protein [Companilactobacillus alimentarius]AUI72051.1 hypothetical protein LA20249_07615 [Companilactobacillus alimentarius DSM 20249]MDT6952588.1 hypothetical protein [Companilactobacillus alimentarius]GEO44824.1 hypothetical protein LAL01_10560 [Companilactobacillus alimentarius]